jgi:outer membrane biosynthesis protein TonB
MATTAKAVLALLVLAAVQATPRAQTPEPKQNRTFPAQTTPPNPQSPPPAGAPRPNPDAAGIYHGGDGVTPSKLIYSVEPEFSDSARKRKITGICKVLLIVNSDGTVREAHVTTSIADSYVNKKDRAAALSLDENCIKTVKQYKFEPAIFQGKPVPVELHVEIGFMAY